MRVIKKKPSAAGDARRRPRQEVTNATAPTNVAESAGIEHLVISAAEQITLQCGESSITLTAAGKIILRGKYIVSRSSGVQRIKGGSVQIN